VSQDPLVETLRLERWQNPVRYASADQVAGQAECQADTAVRSPLAGTPVHHVPVQAISALYGRQRAGDPSAGQPHIWRLRLRVIHIPLRSDEIVGTQIRNPDTWFSSHKELGVGCAWE
jgi:hypothetical protein